MENKDKIIDELSCSPREILVTMELLRSLSYKEVVRVTTLSQAAVAHCMSVLMKKTGSISKKKLWAFLRKMRRDDVASTRERQGSI